MYISIINGPNLNMLGRRQPEIYGDKSLEDIIAMVNDVTDIEVREFHSNCEGALIDSIQADGFDPDCAGIIINPGAYAHYSLAIADALAMLSIPKVEVHISNIHAREQFRHNSVTAPYVDAVIAGCGIFGYKLAADFILNRISGL